MHCLHHHSNQAIVSILNQLIPTIGSWDQIEILLPPKLHSNGQWRSPQHLCPCHLHCEANHWCCEDLALAFVLLGPSRDDVCSCWAVTLLCNSHETRPTTIYALRTFCIAMCFHQPNLKKCCSLTTLTYTNARKKVQIGFLFS